MNSQTKFNRRLGKILTQFNLVKEDVLSDALEKVTKDRSLCEILIEDNVVEEGAIISALSRETSWWQSGRSWWQRRGLLRRIPSQHTCMRPFGRRTCRALLVSRSFGAVTQR